MWRTLKTLGALGAILSVLGLIASFPIQNSFASRAVNALRVERDQAADLFSDGSYSFRAIGSPQMLIIDDPSAFVDAPGVEAPEGTKFVSEDYLLEKGIYPLQLKTVEFVASNARLAFGLALIVSLGLLAVARKRAATAPADS